MSVIEELMEAAEADIGVLQSLDANGDDFNTYRDVDFLIEAPSLDKAENICGFINDYRYGKASLRGQVGEIYQVMVVINMPINQNIITSVSGFMICVANLFGGSLDGWGCSVQK